MQIRTKHVSNANGRGQVRATGGGRQRTVDWEHAVHGDINHRHAAATLARVFGYRGVKMVDNDMTSWVAVW